MRDAGKRWILDTLDKLGYVVVKKPEWTKIVGAAAAASTAPQAAPAHGSSDEASLTATGLEPEFQRFYQGLDGRRPLPAARVRALYAAVHHLITAGVAGDIVDCGNGAATSLAVLGAALAAFDDTSRALLLLDVSGDPTHRAETVLEPWGHEDDLLQSDAPRAAPVAKAPPIPDELVGSGYPVERCRVERSLNAVGGAQPIAFLALTSDSYPANRAAIRVLFPRVPIGGVVSVEHAGSAAGRRDAVAEFLRDEHVHVPFWQITETFRIGIRGAGTGEAGSSEQRQIP